MFHINPKFTHIRVKHFDKRANGPAPYHQIVLPDEVWLNVFENGQITVTTYKNDISVAGLRNHQGGSSMSFLVTPKVSTGDPEGDEGITESAEHIEVFDARAGDAA